MAKWNFEKTDTFGGEANYCWVDRHTIDAHSERDVIRQAYKLAGYSGMRCRTDKFGDMIQITPTGRNHELTTVFLTWDDSD